MSVLLDEVITKLVPATMLAVGAESVPGVPPRVLAERKILELAVTAVVLIVIVPPVMAADVPTESLAAVVAWITSLFPVLPRTKFPFVAVILPRVAVMVVPAVTDPDTDGEPVNAGFAPVEPAKTVPVAATASDETALEAPATRTPCCVMALAVTGLVPLPVSTPVRVTAPVPPLATGTVPVRLIVAVSPEPVVESGDAPAKLILPDDGVTIVLSSVVNVFKSPAAAPKKKIQFACVTPLETDKLPRT